MTTSSAVAAGPVLLPAKQERITIASAQRKACATRSLTGSTIARHAVTAPADGVVTARLNGPATSDWDLAVVDKATGNVLNGSAELGSDEIATTEVTKGEQLIIQSCRRTGSDRTVTQSVQFTKAEPAKGQALKMVRVKFRTDFDRTALAQLDLDGTDNPTPAYQDVILHGAADEAKLKQSGLSYTTRVSDLVAKDRSERLADFKRGRTAKGRAAARAATPGGRTSYRTLPEIDQELKDTAAANPGLVRTFTLPGKSLEGRDIMGIEIAENVTNPPDGRPDFVTVGTHHAREWPSNEATQEFGLDLINGYKSGNPQLSAIVKNARTFVIPVLNVDGFDMTIESEGLNPDGSYTDPVPSGGTDTQQSSGEQAEGSGAYKRKNCRAPTPAEQAIPCLARTYDPADGDDQSGHNDRGVDLNRNYGVSWGGPGSASDVDDLTYHGPVAFSEPESRTFADWLRDHQVSLLFTNHTFSGLILRPPGTSVNGPAPDEQGLRELGDAMAKETTYLSQFSYQLYDTTGTTDDYIYDGLSGFSYTAEIGKSEFHPPYTEFQAEYDGRIAEDDNGNPTGVKLGGLRRAYTLAGLAAISAQPGDYEGTHVPGTHSIIQGTAPAGSTLTIRKDFTYSTDSRPDDDGVQAPDATITEPRVSTLVVPADGKFTWHVDPSSQPRGEQTPWHLSFTDSTGKDTPCKDVFVARGQVVNLSCGVAAPGAGTTPTSCTSPDGFRSVNVKRTGKSLRVTFSKKTRNAVTVEVFQTAKGRKIVNDKRVARFRNRQRSFTWNGRKTSGKHKRVAAGVYKVRFRVTDDAKKLDTRRVVVAKRSNGRFYKKGKFVLETHCPA